MQTTMTLITNMQHSQQNQTTSQDDGNLQGKSCWRSFGQFEIEPQCGICGPKSHSYQQFIKGFFVNESVENYWSIKTPRCVKKILMPLRKMPRKNPAGDENDLKILDFLPESTYFGGLLCVLHVSCFNMFVTLLKRLVICSEESREKPVFISINLSSPFIFKYSQTISLDKANTVYQ